MTKIRFRKFKDDSIIAIFPDLNYPKYTNTKSNCMSYMHIGQHGESDYDYLIDITCSANIEGYSPLLEELNIIGYDDLFIIPF